MMLEGPDAGLRRVLALSRKRMQRKEIIGGSGRHHCAVLCFLEKAENLPGRERRKPIDPYVTFSIIRGNPLEGQQPGVHQRLYRARNKDRKAAIRRFAKSITILEDHNPKWDETIAVAMPAKLSSTPTEELYVHVLLWDYDTLSSDDLVGQIAIPLADMPLTAGKAQPHQLKPIPGMEGIYDLETTRIWVSFCKGQGVDSG